MSLMVLEVITEITNQHVYDKNTVFENLGFSVVLINPVLDKVYQTSVQLQ